MPEGPLEAEGTLNPAAARDRQGKLLLYPRDVARGNESRVGRVKVTETDGLPIFERDGYALEPQEHYEFNGAVGQGCEDPRVAFVAELDLYLMTYTAYGAQGPRAAIAYSLCGYEWTRLGLIEFPAGLYADDKDVAFFPGKVISPKGVKSLALYHRPSVHVPMSVEAKDIDDVVAAAAAANQCIRIAYVPLAAAKKDLHALLHPTESVAVLAPGKKWGRIKVGAGTVPVRIAEGWLSLFHGVDAVGRADGTFEMRYSAGLIVHDAKRPHIVRYVTDEAPLYAPEHPEEMIGTVANVVFPTALVARGDLGPRTFDVYDGQADFCIGVKRLELLASNAGG